MKLDEEDYLAHYGILRRSGRYPWGSGGPEYANNRDFLGYVDSLRQKGLSETEIATMIGATTTQLRAAKSIAKNEQRQSDILMAQRLKDKGYSNGAIAERMGLKGESSVRSLLDPGAKDRADVLQTTASMLREQVDKKGMIDVGTGVENHIGVSRTKLDTAIAMLQEEGYNLHPVEVQQQGTGLYTRLKVLTKPEVTQKEAWQNRANIQQITDFSQDGGHTYLGIQPPLSVDSKRIAIRYKEDGGTDADGVIYVRPGVDDVSLGSSRYAQVRVMVDGSHYLKGMAVYKDDLPEGVDLMFNTNKSSTGNKLDVMKEVKRDKDGNIDMDNPFGANISRQLLTKENGKDKVTSAMNIVNEDEDWEKWSRSLSSQFLSKQSPTLIKTQLDMTYENKKTQLDAITQLTNPAVKRKLLESFADDADSSAVHLKAAALPGQANKVILPLSSIKESEVYAPSFKNGDRVVLVRFPHGGTFEIPELTVNNKNAEGKQLLGDANHAIGIHAKTAARLSGADFDGDTVLIIPNNHGKVKTSAPLDGLKNFDPQSYKLPADSPIKRMTPRQTQIEMGNISNLITDMTIKGANQQELARAVRHSMVVIDAEKHGLNYRQSAIDNGISSLKEKYQGGARAGASTIISRKKQTIEVPERKQGYRIDASTGTKIYRETGASKVDRKTGEVVPKTTTVRKLEVVDDANELSSGTQKEKLYADHSNRLRDLANQARKEIVSTKNTPYSPSAKTAYSDEVASLNAKLNVALKNRPLERKAQLVAEATVSAKRRDNPDMTSEEIKKVKSQALTAARARVGAKKTQVEITPSEWEAIQAGAITNNKLTQILNNTDIDAVKKLATPKSADLMTNVKVARAKAMKDSGYTQGEIAAQLGVSLSTLKRSLE